MKPLIDHILISVALSFPTMALADATLATASGAPTITAVQNNYSYLLPGVPNYGIAPGSLFIIKGNGMAAASAQATLWNLSQGPLPQSAPDSNGTAIAVVVNGTTVHPGIYYFTATQVAAVLPSNTPVGTGTIAVTYNGQTSQTASIVVVPSALGFDTIHGTGSGQAVATDNLTGALINYTASAKPGQIVVLWGSGDGADTANDDLTFPAKQDNLNYVSVLYVGGIQAQVLYQGRSQFPGVDQIDIAVPQGVNGCYVSVVAVSGTGGNAFVSNTVTMPIEQNGGTCQEPSITGDVLASLGSMSSLRTGFLQLSELSILTPPPVENVSNAFGVFQLIQTGRFLGGLGYGVSVGSCIVLDSPGGASGTPFNGLDAGMITVTGASFPLVPNEYPVGDYDGVFGSQFLPAATQFTFNNGSGGKDVGPFTVSLETPTSPFTWTNPNSINAVTRSQGVTITWSGGDPNTFVLITGASTTGAASFSCYALQSALTFTVPSYVLQALPSGAGGDLQVMNTSVPVSFSAHGLDYGSANVIVGSVITVSYI